MQRRTLVLETTLASLTLANPVLSASGTFGSGWEGRQFSDLGHVGALVSKTVTLAPRPGNPPPRIWETPSGMLNSIGLENKGADYFLAESLPKMQQLAANGGPRVVINIGGESIDEFVQLAERFSAAGVIERPPVCTKSTRLPGAISPRATSPHRPAKPLAVSEAIS